MMGYKEKCCNPECVNAAEYVWFPSDKPKSERPVCMDCWKKYYAKEVFEEFKKRRMVK